jgi:hypothetical protein
MTGNATRVTIVPGESHQPGGEEPQELTVVAQPLRLRTDVCHPLPRRSRMTGRHDDDRHASR